MGKIIKFDAKQFRKEHSDDNEETYTFTAKQVATMLGALTVSQVALDYGIIPNANGKQEGYEAMDDLNEALSEVFNVIIDVAKKDE